MKQNYYIKILFILILTAALTSCKDNSSSSDAETNALAVFVYNTGSGDLDIVTSGINFCYEGEGCGSQSGQSFVTVFVGQNMDLSISSTEKVAVGVKGSFEVTGGQGYMEVIRGEAYRDDGFLEFDKDEVIYTSGAFSDGDTVTFDVGNTD